MPPLFRKPPRWFYGWVIVAVCGFTLFIAFGIRLSFTVFFVDLIEAFGWPRADTSIIFSVSMIVFALCSTPAGLALDRWGARPVFSVGAGLIALGLLLSSQIHTLGQLILTYGVVAGIGITILGLGPQASVVARWFRRRRGTAIGLTFAGTGLGSLLLTPGAEYLNSTIGWRATYVALAGLAMAIIPIILLFSRLTPTMMGLYPDGDHEAPIIPLHIGRPSHNNWTMLQVVRSPAFWLVILASLGAVGPLRMLTVHQLAAVVDVGFNRLYAASIIGLAGAITAVAFVIFGALSDRIGRQAAYMIGSFCLLTAIGILGNLQSSEQARWLILYAIMLGLGEGSRASLVTAVASDLFPGNALGAINGAVGSAFGAGAAFFPWLAGHLFDVTNTYHVAFQIAAVAIVISTTSLWIAPKIHQRPL